MSTLVLTNGTYNRITEYVRLIDAEIGMFGYVTMKDGDFYVDDVFLVEQTVTGSSVDFADEGLEYAIQRAIKDDRIGDLMFCCHSHVNMGAFWSPTDEDMIEGMNNGMTPYLVSLVINKRGETEQRVDFYNPPGPLGDFTSQVRYDLDLRIEREDDDVVLDEIDRLVKRQRWANLTKSSRSRSGDYSWGASIGGPSAGDDWFLPSQSTLALAETTDDPDEVIAAVHETNAAGDVVRTDHVPLTELTDAQIARVLGIEEDELMPGLVADDVLLDPRDDKPSRKGKRK